jgi:hypothetical protein
MVCSLFVRLVADGWCLFVLREKYCWLVGDGWFVLREKYCWLVADKPNEQGVGLKKCNILLGSVLKGWYWVFFSKVFLLSFLIR